MFLEYDMVTAKIDLSSAVKAGCIGTIVMVYHDLGMDTAYEVEFFDENMVTLDVLTVNSQDIQEKADMSHQ